MPLLSQRTLRRLLALATLTLLSATLALAQNAQQPSPTTPSPSAGVIPWTSYSLPQYTDWNKLAQLHLSGKFFVITTAHRKLRHRCRVQAFTPDKLVCKNPLGVTHTYKSQKIAALVIPGNYDFKAQFLLGANAGLGAAIWGTVVLAPVCPACAAATAFAALFAFGAASDVLFDDDIRDQLLYLAPGHTLEVRLRY